MTNEEIYLQNLAKIDPKLWRIKRKLLDTGVNADIIPTIIETIAGVYTDTAWGDIVITMENGIITYVIGKSQRRLDIDVAGKIEYNNITTSFE